jgi:hypothetical protein
MLYPAPRFTCRSPRPTSNLTGGGGPRCTRRPRPGRDHSRHTEGPSCAHCRSPNAQRTVLRTGPRPSLRFGARTGRFRGPGHHPLMVSHHHRTDVSAGKKSSRHSEPTVALRASVRRHRSSLGAVIVRESMVTSRQDRIEPRSDSQAASVAPTDARKATVRRFGRSDRRAQALDVGKGGRGRERPCGRPPARESSCATPESGTLPGGRIRLLGGWKWTACTSRSANPSAPFPPRQWGRPDQTGLCNPVAL